MIWESLYRRKSASLGEFFDCIYGFLLYIYLHNYVCTNMWVFKLNYLIICMDFVVCTYLCMYKCLCECVFWLMSLTMGWFFVWRSQMQTIITKACKELGIKPIPSKRVRIAFHYDFVLLLCFYQILSSFFFSLNLLFIEFKTKVRSLLKATRMKIGSWIEVLTLIELDHIVHNRHGELNNSRNCKSVRRFMNYFLKLLRWYKWIHMLSMGHIDYRVWNNSQTWYARNSPWPLHVGFMTIPLMTMIL